MRTVARRKKGQWLVLVTALLVSSTVGGGASESLGAVIAEVRPNESTGAKAMSMEVRAQKEVIELHQFFEDWFLGRDETDFSRLELSLASDFKMVTPGGRVVERGPLIESLRASFGAWASSPKKIEIREQSSLTMADTWIVVHYEEWQLPENSEGVGRLSTAIFRSSSDADLGLEWVRLHETWLPSE